MYIVRAVNEVGITAVAEYEAYQARLTGLAKSQRGFVASALLRSVGTPSKYVRHIWWENRLAQDAATRSAALAKFLEENMTEGLFTRLEPNQGYEDVLNVGEVSRVSVKTATHNEWVLRGVAAVPAFIESRRTLFELFNEHVEAYNGGSLLRHFGDGRRFIVVHRTTEDAEDCPLRSLGSVPQPLIEHLAAHPSNQYADSGPSGDRYERIMLVRR